MTSSTVSLPACGPGRIKLACKLTENPLFTQKPHAWLHIWMTILLRQIGAIECSLTALARSLFRPVLGSLQPKNSQPTLEPTAQPSDVA
jgi:hypothetical protein